MNMLTKNKFLILGFLMSAGIGVNAQTTLDAEVPGDNFSLEGALELFKKSASPEAFEKLLNSPDSKVNNLDLNSDGNIDYIRVIDRNEGNVHAFILQAALSDKESQDVAVIELEKLQDGKAVLQITGDADVYGIETIIEPTEEVRVNAGANTERAVVNVWTWPSVQYVYSPYYSAWTSPWGWGYHPMWWSPWRPVAFYVYSPWWRPYRPYYSLCYSHRIGYLPRLYRPYRTTSVIVHHHHGRQIDRYRSNYSGRDRYEGRSPGSRSRYDGYGGRSRSDNNGRIDNSGRRSTYNNRSNFDNSGRRYEANSNTNTRTRSRYNNNSSTDQRSQSNFERRSTPERSNGRSSSTLRSSPDRSQRSSGIQRTPERRSFTPSSPSPQRQSNVGRSQQRSSGSPSIGRSSGRSSTPSGGGRGGSGNSGGSRGQQRGR